MPLVLFLFAALSLIFYFNRTHHYGQVRTEENQAVSNIRGKNGDVVADIPTVDVDTDISTDDAGAGVPPSNYTNDVVDSKKAKKSKDATCNRNAACEVQGLIGNCCPTDDGVFLDCCSA